MSDIGNNPQWAYRVQTVTDRALGVAARWESDVFPLYSFARIRGAIKSNKALTVDVLQGISESVYGIYQDSFVTNGDANLGAGNKINEEVGVPEGYGQIRVTNNSGEAATFSIGFGLSKA